MLRKPSRRRRGGTPAEPAPDSAPEAPHIAPTPPQPEAPAAPPPGPGGLDPPPAGAAAAPDDAYSDEVFETTVSFEALGLRGSVLKGIHAAEFHHPTKTQAAFIPPILAGRDLLGQAKTGTGKTAAFGLPLLHLCDRETPFQALVLCPTRELAMQISAEIDELGGNTPIRAVAIYGGQRINTQIEKLKHGPQIIVGTPGRVLDMLERGHFHLRNVRFAILDEVDRMLDIGFREDIKRVMRQVPQRRQTIFVSATIAGEIESLARQYMHEPEKVIVASRSLTVHQVKQYYLSVPPWAKRRLLLHLLTHEEPALTLIFCRLKRTVDELAKFLSHKGIDAHPIHADLGQGRRNEVMKRFRDGSLSVLVASDLASRGIDVEGITHVVNYDLPDDIELYVHRIGRTARAGRDGVAWSLVTPEQGEQLTEIEKLINVEIPKLDYPDFDPGPPPQGFHTLAPSAALAAPGQAHAPPPEEKRSRFEAGATPALPVIKGTTADPKKFPGGIVPTKMPPKRMQGRVPTTRSDWK